MVRGLGRGFLGLLIEPYFCGLTEKECGWEQIYEKVRIRELWVR